MPSRRRFLATAGAAAAAGVAGCTSLDDPGYEPGTDDESEWPMPAYDTRFTGHNPDAAGPRDGVTERWAPEIPHPSDRPVVAAGTVLVPTISALVALDLGSGEERWRYGDAQPWVTAPVVHDGVAYAGFADEPGLVALDVETGDVRWRVDTTGAVRAAPTFDYGRNWLYVGDDVGDIYRVDLDDGTVDVRGNVFGAVSALASYNSLFVGTESGEVYNVYPHHGEFTGVWRRNVEGAVTSLTTDTGSVYVGTFGGTTYCLGTQRRGGSRWEVDDGGANVAATRRDVVACDGGGVASIGQRTGETAWHRDGRFGAAPAITGDTLYAGGGEVGGRGYGFVAAYELSGGTGIGPLQFGGERWRFDVDSAVVEGVAVADGAVFAVTQDVKSAQSRIYALDPA